jgi:hypothetical protein
MTDGFHRRKRQVGKGWLGQWDADSSAAPRYEAWHGPDTLVSSDDDLEYLLGTILQDQEGSTDREDIVVFESETDNLVACVVDGQVVRLATDEPNILRMPHIAEEDVG